MSTGMETPLFETRSILFIVAAACLGTAAHAHSDGDTGAHALAHLFADGALVTEPQIVDCTLSGGTQTKCYAVTVVGTPVDHSSGPWCPSNISDGADAGGIWLENGEVHAVDGRFIENIATFYDDPEWSLFDPETGRVNVTDTFESCMAAARPDVAEEFNNHCVECQLSYFPDVTEHTYVLPIEPVPTNSTTPVRGPVGVALNGVRIDGPAPRDAILDAHTLAPFDDCGGHVNPFEGYHYHAMTGCSTEVAADDGHAAQIGFALDGYKLFARLDADGEEPSDLDECRGHDTAGLGYHYHANAAGSNQILPCLRAEQGCALSGDETSCDASARRGPPEGGRPPEGGPPPEGAPRPE